jgi:glyceraldehyde-3-phosphate dehydrogenase (ferredoxin)
LSFDANHWDMCDYISACPLDQSLVGPAQYGWDRFQKDPDSMTFGGGLLAGSPLPGARRVIFCGCSPPWSS